MDMPQLLHKQTPAQKDMDAARKAWNEDRMARLKRAIMDWSRTSDDMRERYEEMTPHEVLNSIPDRWADMALAEQGEWQQRGQ